MQALYKRYSNVTKTLSIYHIKLDEFNNYWYNATNILFKGEYL